jgi:hypothetical protein
MHRTVEGEPDMDVGERCLSRCYLYYPSELRYEDHKILKRLCNDDLGSV